MGKIITSSYSTDRLLNIWIVEKVKVTSDYHEFSKAIADFLLA